MTQSLTPIRNLISRLSKSPDPADKVGDDRTTSVLARRTPIANQTRIKTLDPERFRVLLVEDDLAVVHANAEHLAARGFEVHCATNGLQALAKTAHLVFDAILSDLNMPEMNGLELLETLRGLGNTTPFVFLTGYGKRDQAVRALRLGAMDMLDKPCSPENLAQALKRAAQLGRAEQLMNEELARLSADPAAIARLNELSSTVRELRSPGLDRVKKTGSDTD